MPGRSLVIVIFLLAAFLSGRSSAHEQITVAAAASVQFALGEIDAAFTRETGIEVKPVFGASGKLTAQIRNGAPFDVFVSADMDYPDSLHAWGRAAQPPAPYAYGKLVLWTLKDLDLGKGLAVLLDPAVRHIALADPKLAPYGQEAVRAMRAAGVLDRTGSKLAYGESISQVTQYILTGNVEVGFDAKSVVMAGELKGKGHWVEVDSSLYRRISQGAVVCRYGSDKHASATGRYLDFLYSEPARVILRAYGYATP